MIEVVGSQLNMSGLDIILVHIHKLLLVRIRGALHNAPHPPATRGVVRRGQCIAAVKSIVGVVSGKFGDQFSRVSLARILRFKLRIVEIMWQLVGNLQIS